MIHVISFFSVYQVTNEHYFTEVNEIVIKIHTATDISRKNIDKQFDNGHFLWLQQFRIKSY